MVNSTHSKARAIVQVRFIVFLGWKKNTHSSTFVYDNDIDPMNSLRLPLAFIASGLLASGCMPARGPDQARPSILQLAVSNSPSQGGTGLAYTIAQHPGMVKGTTAYVDRSLTVTTAVPDGVRGQVFIQTADGDKTAAAGSSNFISFTVSGSSTVYIAHDTRITIKPTWLTANFMDTGKRIRVGPNSFELYSNVYPAHASIVLGSNIATAGNDPIDMYSVIVAPTASDIESPAPPTDLRADCATAAVVGLQWTAAVDNANIAGYRISRNGTLIGTTFTSRFADTAVSGTASYRYVVTAFDSAGNTAEPKTLDIRTPAPLPNGDAPYCHSAVIESMHWHWSEGYTQPNGSDLWPVTWGKDGNVYAFFGDGGGFGGDNWRGRASFGIATIAGTPPAQIGTAKNIYGGYGSRHRSTLNGKASSIIAVGSSFYTLGGIFRSTDSRSKYPSQRSGSPDRVEIAYSVGNAYSWRTVDWEFCRPESERAPRGMERFCPMRFVNFGPGNSGAADGYVYLLELDAQSYWEEGIKTHPIHTYLARVPPNKLRNRKAYEYFCGLNSRGEPIWRAETDQIQPVFTDRNANQPGCGGICSMSSALSEIVYSPAIKRYIGIAQGDYVGQTSFYDAPNLWGPWTVIEYHNIAAASGSGGWGNLGTAAGGSMGVHPVNAWTAASGETMWFIYSSDGKAPADAWFPPGGTAMDSFNLVSVDLRLSAKQ